MTTGQQSSFVIAAAKTSGHAPRRFMAIHGCRFSMGSLAFSPWRGTQQAGKLQATCRDSPCEMASRLLQCRRVRQMEMFGSCRKLVRSGIANGAVVLLFLALQTLAASPQLHHALHPDSNQPSHQCVVKLF